MNNAKIIAVDFDGTLVENKWPEIGAPIEKNIAKVKAEQEAGAKIILWTNRVGEPLEKALSFCKEQGIHLDAVNENLPEIIKAFREPRHPNACGISKQASGKCSPRLRRG